MHNKVFRIVLVVFLLPIMSNLFAQDAFEITYLVTEPKIHGSEDKMDEKGRDLYKQVLAYVKDLRYTLTATETESYFERRKMLTTGDNSPLKSFLLKSADRFTAFNSSVYSNNKQDSIMFVRNLVNKDFVVKRSFYDFNWIIKNENKKILGLDAKKAEGKYYDSIRKRNIVVVAWFIPSIPLKSGPDIFMGLPGLIAEINLERAIVKVEKIESIQNLNVKKIDASEVLSEIEYSELIGELTRKFIDD